MGTTYYCDVCKEETKLQRDLVGILVAPRRVDISPHIIPCEFDVCVKCGEKMLKPVVEMRSTHNVSFIIEDGLKE